jgi:hypothetical protein
MTARAFVTLGLLLAVASIAAACGDATTATSPTTTSPVTETFIGQFSPGGGASRSFTSASSGSAIVTLTQDTAPADATVGLGIGIPQANNAGCYLTQTMPAVTGTTLTVAVEAGTYCVRLYDAGGLTAPVAFTLTIVRP